ncbi:MAG: histidine kinase [Eubacteriales bacterium]
MTQVSQNINYIIADIDTTALALTTNYQITSTFYDIVSTEKMNYYESIRYSTIKELLDAQISTKSYINSIYIAFEDVPDSFFSTNAGLLKKEVYSDNTDWTNYINYESDTNNYSHLNILDSRNVVISFYRQFSFGMPLKNSVMVLNLNQSVLEDTLTELSLSDGQVTFITNSDEILVSSNASMNELWQSELQTLLQTDLPYFELTVGNTAYFISKNTDSTAGLQYFLISNKHNLYAVPYTMLSIVLIVILLLVVFTSIHFAILNHKQYTRLKNIISILEEYGDDVGSVSKKQQNEYEYIASRIEDNFLLNKFINTELTARTYEKKYLEITSLQSQINPHMLYNTMEIIQWKACKLTNSYNDVAQMLDCISGLMKYSLSEINTFVPLSREINNTATYIKLINLRYPNQFNFIWDYPEAILNLQSMRLILQPIIENAIAHGRRKDHSSYTIRIKISYINDFVKINIFNTGQGMTYEQKGQLLDRLNLIFAPAKGMGLYNINKRLQLQYGTKLRIYSSYNRGTSVSFSFPAQLTDIVSDF